MAWVWKKLLSQCPPRPDLIYPGRRWQFRAPSVSSAGGSGTGTDAEANSRRTSFRCGGLLCGYYSGDDLSWNSFKAYQDTISTIAAFSYEINWDGSVSGQAYQGLLKEAKAAGKPVLALVHNISASGGFDRNLVQAVLSNPSLRQTAVANIARTVRDNGYAGVNVDFEDVPTYDRDLYTAFVRELAAVLQKTAIR